MNKQSIHKLWKVKKLINGSFNSKKAVQLINSVLLDENGPVAVLYPYNNHDQEIIALYGEGMSPDMIAKKLGVDGDGDIGPVMDAIEAPGNYVD